MAAKAEGSSENEGEATAGTAGTDTAEDVDIPKQQTAEQAADNDAGEGART
ncbi:gliding motility protein [Streptomyces sp. NPDC005141]